MRRGLVFLGVLFVLLAPACANAAPKWLPPRILAEGTGGNFPDVAVAPSGAAVVAWQSGPSGQRVLKAMYRPAGGPFGDPQTISSGTAAGSPKVAIDDDGRAVVGFNDGSLQYRTYTPGTGWAAPRELATPPGVGGITLGDVVLRNGRIALIWSSFTGAGNSTIVGAMAPFGDAPNIQVLGPSTGSDQVTFNVALDDAGDAMFVWERALEVVYRPWAAGAPGPAGAVPGTVDGGGPNDTATNPSLVMFPDGKSLASYNYANSGTGVTELRTAIRTTSAWTNKFTASQSGEAPTAESHLALARDGSAVVAYRTSNDTAIAADRLAGNVVFTNFNTLSAPGASNVVPTIGASGDTLVTYRQAARRWATLRPAGGGLFGQSTEYVTGLVSGSDASGGVDDQGNALVAVGGQTCVGGGCPTNTWLITYDARPPSLESSSIPETATAGAPVAFSAAASDRASEVTYSWDFGDGSQSSNATTQHAFAVGTYNVKFTATDEAGNSVSAAGTLNVTPAPPDGPGGGGGGVKPAQVSAAASGSFKAFKKYTVVKKLGVKAIPAGATIYVKCIGKRKGCPLKKTKKYTLKKDTKSKDLTSLFKPKRRAAKLKPGLKVEIGISAPSLLGRFTTWTIRGGKKPKAAKGCLAVGTTKHTAC